jgi:TolA-binding protein
MRKTLVLGHAGLVGLLLACSPSPQPAPLDAPMVDLPVASSSAGATPIATTSAAPVSDATPVPTNGCAVAIPARDRRKSRLQARSAPLLATEIQGLEQLNGATAPTAPDRPQLLRRLAEDYAELACALFASGDQAGTRKARQDAIAKYEAIVNGYPSYAALDEVYYYAALEHELLGDLRSARSQYYSLISKFPNSKHIPAAYFAFGEMFFAEGAADPSKNQLAEQAYREVLKYPAPGNPVRADAEARLKELQTRSRGP